jgi:protein-S-isoprenylcysteine O-methyltransferase Ste14
MQTLEFINLGNLLLGVALLFSGLIVIFECLERRRESRRERRLLAAIDAEYQAYLRMGRL